MPLSEDFITTNWDTWEETLEMAVALPEELEADPDEDWTPGQMVDRIAEVLEGLEQQYIPASHLKPHLMRLSGAARVALEVEELVREVIRSCPEFGHIATYVPARLMIIWRAKPWTSQKREVWGQVKVAEKRHRECYPSRPWWWMDLSLARWLVLDPAKQERRRLIHHELCHLCLDEETGGSLGLKPAIKPHTVEEFPETTARFGLHGLGQAQLAQVLLERVETRVEIRREWPDGQQPDLFLGPYRAKARAGESLD